MNNSQSLFKTIHVKTLYNKGWTSSIKQMFKASRDAYQHQHITNDDISDKQTHAVNRQWQNKTKQGRYLKQGCYKSLESSSTKDLCYKGPQPPNTSILRKCRVLQHKGLSKQDVQLHYSPLALRTSKTRCEVALQSPGTKDFPRMSSKQDNT